MIILSCDHAGYDYCQRLIKFFKEENMEFKYMGPAEFNQEDDYPDFIHPAAKEVLKDEKNMGIFICGSGVGANIVANRYKGIRAVCAQDTATAFLARKDEDANVITFGSRLTGYRTMLKIIKVFMRSEFEGGRHLRRISKY